MFDNPEEHVRSVSVEIYKWLVGGAKQDPTIHSGMAAAHKIAEWYPGMGPKFYRACADVYDEASPERWN